MLFIVINCLGLDGDVEVVLSLKPKAVLADTEVALKCSFATSTSDVEIHWERENGIIQNKDVRMTQRKFQIQNKLHVSHLINVDDHYYSFKVVYTGND